MRRGQVSPDALAQGENVGGRDRPRRDGEAVALELLQLLGAQHARTLRERRAAYVFPANLAIGRRKRTRFGFASCAIPEVR
jgi:hypothetical protein